MVRQFNAKESGVCFNICLVTTHFLPYRGGVENYNIELVSFMRQKLSYDICCTVLTYVNKELFKNLNNIMYINVPKHLFKIITSLTTIKGLFTFVRVLLRILLLSLVFLKNLRRIRECSFLISSGAFVEAIITYVYARIFNKKYIVIWHTTLKHFLNNVLIRPLLIKVLTNEQVKGVIVNAPDIAKDVKWFGQKNVHIRKQWVDFNCFRILDKKQARVKLGLPMNKIIILYAAPLNKTKFADLVIEAARKVLSVDRDFYFIFIGEGPLEKSVKALVQRYPGNTFFINGFIPKDRLSIFINASDLVVGAADAYYISKLTAEALSCGTPVLLPNVSIHDRSRKIRFNIGLQNVFTVNPIADEIALFLMNMKQFVREISWNATLRLESRKYIINKYRDSLYQDLRFILNSIIK